MDATEKENAYSETPRDWVGILNRLNAAIAKQRSSIRCLRKRHEKSTRRFRKRLQALSICRQHCIAKARKELDRKLAQKDPARVLPPEIVAEVFAYTVAGHAQMSAAYDDLDVHRSAPWVLSRVSSVWRAIALSTPAVWSILTLDDSDDIDDHWPRGREALLRTFLSRSRAHPLHVTHIAADSYSDFDFVMSLLHDHANHLASLDLTATHVYLFYMNDPFHFFLLVSAHFPVLRSVRLQVEGSFNIRATSFHRRHEVSPVIPDIAMFSRAPMLSELSLQAVPLSTLRLGHLDRLEMFSGDIACTKDLYALFRNGKNLRSATLSLPTHTRILAEEHPEPVVNTSLRHLYIMLNRQFDLTLIRLPNLTSLLLLQSHTPWRLSNLMCAPLISSAAHLERLAIDAIEFEFASLRAIIEACTVHLAVLSLHFETAHTASDFYRLITRDEDKGSWMLPGLKQLYVRDDGSTSTYGCPMPFSGDKLLPMLHSRSDEAVGGVQRLERLVLNAPYWTATSSIAFLDRCESLLGFQSHGIDVQFHVGYARSVLVEEDAFAVHV